MSHRLKPYIPFASSLVFDHEGADPSPACQVHTGFTPRWFRQHMDADFGRTWHMDPVLRQQSFIEMGRVLNREFPALKLGGAPEEAAGSISQIQTTALMGALFGMDIQYFPDNWPANVGPTLGDAAAARLRVPDFAASPVFENLMQQMDLIEREWGAIPGELNYQGVLNIAFRLRGEDIFMDMIAEPDRAHHVLRGVCETLMQVVDAVYARQAAAGVRKDFFTTANCVVNMISEAQYREFVQPYDRRLSDHFPFFGIHNCAWRVDPYAAAYAEIRRLGYLDFGIESDLGMLQRTFPDTTLVPIYTPMDLVNRTSARIRDDLENVRRHLPRCRIVLADIDAGTAPERVVEFHRIVADLWNEPIEAVVAEVRNV